MVEVAALGVTGQAVDRFAFFDQPAAAACAGGPVAADRDRRRAGDPVGGAVVADVGGAASLHAADLARIPEGLELLFAAEVEGDRGAAADRVGDVDAFGVGLDLGGADVEVGVAELDPLFRHVDRVAVGDEGAERGQTVGVGGDEDDQPRPGRAAEQAAGAGIEAVGGGEDQLPARRVDRRRRAEALLVALADEEPAVDGERDHARFGDRGEARFGSIFERFRPVEGRAAPASGPGSSSRGRVRLHRASTGPSGGPGTARARRRQATARRARSPRVRASATSGPVTRNLALGEPGRIAQ